MHAWSSCLSHRSIANARSHSVHATASDSIAHGTDEARVSARLRLQLVPTRGQPLRVGETLLPRLRCSPLLCTLRLSGQKSSAAPCAAAARRRRANPARRRSPGRRRTAAHDAAKREKTHTKERERVGDWEPRRGRDVVAPRTGAPPAENGNFDPAAPLRGKPQGALHGPGLKATNRGRRLLTRRLIADASTTSKR